MAHPLPPTIPRTTDEYAQRPGPAPYRRIATEEAWMTPELFHAYRELLARRPADEPGFISMWGRFIDLGGVLLDRLLDVDAMRIADMDAAGIDVQLLLLTAPGVQVFAADTAIALAADSNDQLAAAIRRHPTRLAGLAAIAPQDPVAAARELERAVTRLGLKGAVINSHTKGEYLDDPRFWVIFEAAEALDVPIYIHPRTPAPAMLQPFLQRGMDRALMGFGVEVALHTLAIITSGAFDRFPRLKIVIGHAGEGLPYWLYRLDYMQQHNRAKFMPELRHLPSDYLRENIYVTNSGVPWAPAITLAQSVLGVDRVLYAMDYPYQYQPCEVAMVDALPLDDADKRRFFQGNAERLFRL
ncbi:MAG: amidohydrolase [Gammaproteobacteria bacterium]|nr:amidohydrolase [Gammaproteobacteria bacterium]